MGLATLCLLVAGMSAPSADRDSIGLSSVRARLPADIQAKLQSHRALPTDTLRAHRGSVAPSTLKAAREEREKLLKALPPQERARMEATLRDLERIESERANIVHRKAQAPSFRE